MYDASALLFLYAETPVHWGTGSSLSAVDLPVQRERHTGYPMAQAAGLKGSLRDAFEWAERNGNGAERLTEWFFGPGQGQDASDHAGCLGLTDARLLLFPVRSLKGTYVLATSRVCLQRLARDAARVLGTPVDWEIPPEPGEMEALVVGDKRLVNGKLILDEFSFDVREPNGDAELGKIAGWIGRHAFAAGPAGDAAKNLFAQRLVLLPEDAFRDFVTQATIVETHVVIDDETGTAKDGLLYSQEVLPPECVFWSLVLARKPFESRENGKNGVHDKYPNGKAVIGELARRFGEQPHIQTGGDATTGRGQVLLKVEQGQEEGSKV